MKIFLILRRGIIPATLLSVLAMASAQNPLMASSVTSLTDQSTPPPAPPPPPPPPPPRMAAPVANAVTTRGTTTTARGTRAARGTNNIATSRPATLRGALAPTSSWGSEQAMNDAFVLQFNNTGDFGGGRMPSPTMRIDPRMRLNLTSEVKIDGPAKTVSAAYRIYSLELIGIAMHDKPVAFVVVRHKDNTASLNNRLLTDFEESALKQLQAGKQVVSQMEKTDRLMVGAVRAEQSCIQCHTEAKVGDLLGAFSYHLSLADNSAMPPATTKTSVGANPPQAPTFGASLASLGH